MFCPNCGFSYDGTSKFCPQCGAMLPTDAQQVNQPVTPPAPQPDQNYYAAPQAQPEQNYYTAPQAQPEQNYYTAPQAQPEQNYYATPQAQPEQNYYTAPQAQPEQNYYTAPQAQPEQNYYTAPQAQPEAQDQPVQQPMYAQPAPFINEVEPQQIQHESPSEKTSTKKKFYKKPKFWIVTALIVALITVPVVLCVSMFGNFFMKLFASDESYAQYVHENAVEDVADDFSEIYAELKGNLSSSSVNGVQSYASQVDLDLEVGEKVLNILSKETGVDLSWAKKVSFKYNLVQNKGKMMYEVAVVLNNVDIISFDVILDFVDTHKMYITSKELIDKYISFPFPEDFSLEASNRLNQILSKLPSPAVMERLVNRYLGIIVEQFENVDKKNDTIEIGSVKANYEKYTVTIDANTISNIFKAVLKKAANDNDIKNILRSFESLLGDDLPTEGSLVQNFEQSLRFVPDMITPEMFGDIKFFYSFWVDGDGDIKGIEIDVDGNIISFVAPEKGKKSALELKISSANTGTISFSGESVVSDEKINGKYTLVFQGQEIITIDLIDYDEEANKYGIKEGAIEIAPSASIMNMLTSELVSNAVPAEIRGLLENGIKIRLESKAAGNGGVSIISILSGNDNLVSVSAGAEMKTPTDIKIPEESVDQSTITEPSDLGINLESVLTSLFIKLRLAGVPDEIFELIQNSIPQ